MGEKKRRQRPIDYGWGDCFDMITEKKNVLIIGAGISGMAAAGILCKRGANVTLSDTKSEAELSKKFDFAALKSAGVKFVFGRQEESLLDGVDLLLLSPVVPVAVPIAQAAIKRGIYVTNEVEFAAELAKSPFVAVTGTNGKTTTVTLLGKLLETSFAKVGVGGNIGVPLCEEALRVGENGVIAAEISSYQMEAAHNFHPHVSAILNVTPDHIKRHGSMDVYQAMKERIFAAETADDFVILNYDDTRTREMAKRAKGQVCFFSRRTNLKEGAFVEDNCLVIKWQGAEHKLVTIDELGIKGGHNVENALAAAACAFFMGVSAAAMVPVLRSFKGVEHRIEFVTEINGVPFYNDSKATNTDSAIKALETFPEHIILIAGGDDKGTDLQEFMTLVKERVDELVLVGAAAARFREGALTAGFDAAHIHEAGYSMEKAVELSRKLAAPPQIVLLSPACASFDMYDGFEERGHDFKRIVTNMAEGKAS